MTAAVLGLGLELAALAALGWWGWTVAPRVASAGPRPHGPVAAGRTTAARVGLAVGAPVIWSGVWATLFSPDPVVTLPTAAVAVDQTGMFLVGAACLVPAGRRTALTAGAVALAGQVLVLALTAR